jgi:hypothetical protein
MRKNRFQIGDLVEITNTESNFKAHPDMMAGKLALVVRCPPIHSSMFIYFVLVDGFEFSIMEEHLKKPAGSEKTKQHDEYTD